MLLWEDTLNDFLPEMIHVGSPLAGALGLIDARELVLASADVDGVGGVDLNIALRRHVKKL